MPALKTWMLHCLVPEDMDVTSNRRPVCVCVCVCVMQTMGVEAIASAMSTHLSEPMLQLAPYDVHSVSGWQPYDAGQHHTGRALTDPYRAVDTQEHTADTGQRNGVAGCAGAGRRADAGE